MANYWVAERHTINRPGQGVRHGHQIFPTPLAAYNEIEGDLRIRQSWGELGNYVRTFKFTVRLATWQEREQYWFDQGDYQQPCWKRERWWQDRKPELREHYAHISVDDPTQIAFTASEADGERDRQTRMNPGRYLKRYFADVLTDKQIAYMAEWWTKGEKPLEAGVELRFAKTPEEIAQVYIDATMGDHETNVTSCMDARHFGDPAEHPARVYGAGDLQLAYLYCSTSMKPIGRALCWPEKKAFFRVYPSDDQSRQDQLRALLRGKGWQDIYEKENLFDGARLLKIEQHGNYVMPYLDVGYGVCHGSGDKRDFWVMSRRNYEYECDNTSGRLQPEDDEDNEPYATCHECDDSIYDEDNAHSVATSVHTVGIIRGGSHRTFCQGCYENDTFYCEGLSETFVDTVDRTTTADGTHYVTVWFEREGGYECGHDGESYMPNDEQPIEMANGETWATCNAWEHGFLCEYDGQWYPLDDMSEHHPGFPAIYDDCAIRDDDRVAYHTQYLYKRSVRKAWAGWTSTDPRHEGGWFAMDSEKADPECFSGAIDYVVPATDTVCTLKGRTRLTPPMVRALAYQTANDEALRMAAE